MEKIKSVLSGHKKSEDATHDAPHDAHTSSAGTHHEGEAHPIYDQMKSSSSAQPTTTGTTTSAGQTGTSTGLGHTEHMGTGGSLGDHSVRPGAPGAGNMHEGISEASIKSGVIGFGTGERQEHAALSSRQNPEAGLDRNQVVGGGNMAPGPTTADTSEQPSTLPLSGTSAMDQSHGGIGNTGMPGNTTQTSTERQPYEQTLRQESYTNDTDRSFPLAGGVAPKHDSSVRHPTEHHSTEHHTTSTLPLAQQASSSHHPVTSAREPGTKEKEVGVRDGHGREGLAGAAAAAAAVGVAAPLSQSHERGAHDQGLETRDAAYGTQPSTTSSTLPTASTTGHTTQSHHPEALAAATAAAAKSSTALPTTHDQGIGASAVDTQSHASRYTDPGRPPGGRSISYRHVPGGFPTPTPDDSKTFLFYRDEVVPKPGVDGPVVHHVPSTRGTPYGQHQLESRAAPVTAGTASGLAGSHAPHHDDTIGGTSTDISSTQHGIGHTTNAPVVGGESTAVPAGQHELRHTGSLEQPRPHSAEYIEEHHHGRDAAIAGGLGAGAAGLGYAATHKRDTPEAAGENLPQESSPYSAKQLDPRVLGSQAKLDEQRYDPQAQSTTTTHQSLHSSAPVAASSTHEPHGGTIAQEKSSTGPHKSSLLNKLDPRVKNDSPSTTDSAHASTKEKDPQDHRARDAALVGGGAATAAGVHHSLQRNDTPGTGTAVLPEEQSSRSAGPLSSTTVAPQHSASTSAPLSGATSSVPGQTSHTSGPLSSSTEFSDYSSHPAATKKYEPYQGPANTSGSPFYGAHGAPAPLEATSENHPSTSTSAATAPLSHHQDPHTSTSTPATQHQDPQHHYGRDATLAGAGVATAGGLAHAGHHDDRTETGPASNTLGPHSSNTANVLDPRVQPDPSKQIHHNVGSTAEDPASRTIGPHSSNIANVVDPRVQPDPSKQKAHTTTGPHQSDSLNRLDPQVDEKAGHQGQHHLGRDAALVGGTGAAGYGAYEAMNAYGDHRSTQPGASMNEQRYDPSASGAHAPNPVPAAGHYDYNNEHTSRNAALGSGAVLGAGALGGAAYAGTRHADNTQQIPASSSQPLDSSTHAAPLTQSYPTQGSSTIAPQNTRSAGTSHAPHDSVVDAHGQDHYKRDAALLGTAGAATVGGAAYAHNQHSDVERERAQLEKEQQERLKREQHDREKEQHKLDKEHSKLEKEQHKHEKEQHKHEKAVVAAEKEEHKHEKEREKEAHRLEKEREKETGTPEKKHGILGFLHRDKSKKEKTSADTSPRHSGEVRRSTDNKRHSKEYAAGGAALGAGTTAAAYDDNHPDSPRWKGRNRLHKDPPVGHPARESLDHHEMGEMSGKREHFGTDGPIGNANAISGLHETRHNTYGAEPLSEALGHDNNKVIEPHTGLPMNVGRFGDGHGGTDANPTIHGHHGHAAGAGTTTDWEAIKKADTPY